MALSYIVNLPVALFNILFCVDSRAMLYSLNSTDSKEKSDIIYEIKHLVHCLNITGTGVTFCWIPSHCGLTFNEWRADRPAKRAAINNMQSAILDVPLSSKEMCNIIENDMCKRLGFSRSISHYPVFNNVTRSVSSLVYRLLLNAIKTKFSKDIMYICKEELSVYPGLFNCQLMKSFLSPEWSSDGHAHLSLQNLLVRK